MDGSIPRSSTPASLPFHQMTTVLKLTIVDEVPVESQYKVTDRWILFKKKTNPTIHLLKMSLLGRPRGRDHPSLLLELQKELEGPSPHQIYKKRPKLLPNTWLERYEVIQRRQQTIKSY